MTVTKSIIPIKFTKYVGNKTIKISLLFWRRNRCNLSLFSDEFIIISADRLATIIRKFSIYISCMIYIKSQNHFSYKNLTKLLVNNIENLIRFLNKYAEIILFNFMILLNKQTVVDFNTKFISKLDLCKIWSKQSK